MGDIYKYNIINPTTNTKKPFFDTKRGIFYIPLNKTYRYFVEAAIPHKDGGDHYHLLLSKIKFNESCRLCNTDDYGRVKVKLKGEIKHYVEKECRDRGNVNVEYIESIDDYDVFSIE